MGPQNTMLCIMLHTHSERLIHSPVLFLFIILWAATKILAKGVREMFKIIKSITLSIIFYFVR